MQPLWIPPGKAAPIFNSLKSMIVFFWEFVLCSKIRFNLFIVTIFDSNSIVWLACGIQLCQIQSVHWGKNIWNMMCELRPEISFIWHLMASFWQQFFWFPLYIWSKNYLHFHISCPNNKKRRSYKCHNKSIGALDNKHPHNYHTQLQYPGWLKIPCLIKNVHLFFLFWLFCCSVARIHIWQGWAHKLFF